MTAKTEKPKTPKHQGRCRCGLFAPGSVKSDGPARRYVLFRCSCGWAWSVRWEQLKLGTDYKPPAPDAAPTKGRRR